MSQAGAESPELRCPTCQARQVWSDTCRRCRTDLTLVVQVLRQRQALRGQSLSEMSQGRWVAAARLARRAAALAPDTDARRVWTVSLLAQGQVLPALRLLAPGHTWPTAEEAERHAAQGEATPPEPEDAGLRNAEPWEGRAPAADADPTSPDNLEPDSRSPAQPEGEQGPGPRPPFRPYYEI